MLKLLFFPVLLAFPLLRFLFRLPWVVYFALAAGAGYLAYGEYQNHLFQTARADMQIAAGPPAPAPLSKWNSARDVAQGDEVNIQGRFFQAMPTGTFEAFGGQRSFILLVDDQGREVKAALVVRPADLAQVQRQLQVQGQGQRFPVTVNGTFNRDGDWAQALESELFVMAVPRAADLVVIEPFLGARASFLAKRAEKTLTPALILAALAGLLVLYSFGRRLTTRSDARKSAKGHQTNRLRAAKRSKAYDEKAHSHAAMPDAEPWAKPATPQDAPDASPWGRFKPTPPNNGARAKPEQTAKGRPAADTAPPPATPPAFKSVFPGGGSGFRFKTADEIILGTFGGLSAQRAAKRRE